MFHLKYLLVVFDSSLNKKKYTNHANIQTYYHKYLNFLASVDDDLPKETLKYQVQSCWWGTVSLEADVTTPINYFTQEQVDKGMIVFRHQSKYLIIILVCGYIASFV